MQIAQSKTRERFPLSRKKVLKKTLMGTVAWIILLLILGIIFIFAFGSGTDIAGYMALAIAGLLALMFFIVKGVYLYLMWYFAVYFYDLTPDYIVIRKGPITPKEITIPYERVQDVYVDQDLLDRIMGLYDVHLSSATVSSGMEAHIDGVEVAAAHGLRDMLLQTVSERISKRKVPVPPSATP